jgi:hypothetical protein
MSRTNEHSERAEYPAEKARQGEIILRSSWQRAIFIAGLAGAIGLPLVMIAASLAQEPAKTVWPWFVLVTAGVALLGLALAYGRANSPHDRDQKSRADERDSVLDVPGEAPKRKEEDS